MSVTDPDLTLGEEICNWIERTCCVPEGALIGQPIELMQWQRDAILKTYDNPHGTTRRCIISVGRKSGKTTFAACLLLAHLIGPAAVPNSQLYSTAASRDQAALLYSLAAKIVRMSPRLSDAITCRDGTKQLHCPGKGTLYRALSADAATNYGLSPVLIIHDELGQVRGARSELFEALETSVAGQLAPLSIIISTQAPTDNDLLSILIDDAMAGYDPRVVCLLYTAPMDLDPFALETIKLANPALGVYQNPKEVLAMAKDAKRMPSRQASYKNLILNQRVEASAPFVSAQDWKACNGEPLDLTGREIYGGLDLSETKDLTALVLIGRDIRDGSWSVECTFWLPREGLHEKSRADKIPYDQWEQEGYLQTSPGPVVSYEHVAHHLKQVFAQHHVVRLGFDRWNMSFLKPWLLHAGFFEQLIEERFAPFGHSYEIGGMSRRRGCTKAVRRF
jgi:phage terminase large subunit-like protein